MAHDGDAARPGADDQPAPVTGIISPAVRRAVETVLAPVDGHLQRAFPGARPVRQPVHTVYVPADRYHPGLGQLWGQQALAAVEGAGGMAAVLESAGVRPALREAVGHLVAQKLATEPIEDLRIDFEDGYGDRGRAEDSHAVAAAEHLRTDIDSGQVPPFAGIRFKSLERATRDRGLRTLEIFLAALHRSGPLPRGLHLTLPKVSDPAQVVAMKQICAGLEAALGLPAGQLRFEVQVETPQAILAADGTAAVARMVHAGAGRVSALHYGTYDYSASLGIAGAYQSMAHRSADHAKAVMQLAAAGTGVWLSDGSTNVLPVGDRQRQHEAWALHARLVRRSLESGYYQGWDLHPAHLVTRFAATYAFYREGFDEAAARLSAYLGRDQGGRHPAGEDPAVLDEPATARALAWFVLRGLDCGALDTGDLSGAGIDDADLRRLAGR